MNGVRKKVRDKKPRPATRKYPSEVTTIRRRTPSQQEVTPIRRRSPSQQDINLNKSRQTHASPNGGNHGSRTGYPVGRSFSRNSVLATPSLLIEQSHVSSSAKHGPEKQAADISDYVHDTSVWEAMEIRFLDKGKCTVLRPNLSSVLSSAEASVTSHCSVKNSNPAALVYPRAHLLNAPLPIRRQKVCVEKVHVRNLLNTKREKCGNLSSSRLSEYMPHITDDATRKKCDKGDDNDISQISKSTSSCVSDTDTFESVTDSNVLRSMEGIICNKRASLKTVNGAENIDHVSPCSQSTHGFQKGSTMSGSRDSNEGMGANESPHNPINYCNSLDVMTSQTDKRELYRPNLLKSSSAIGNSAFAYRGGSNFGQEKVSKFDLAEKCANHECSTNLSPYRFTNDHNSSSEEEHSSAECCISAEKPTCQTRRVIAKNQSFGSAESSYEYVSNKLCPSDNRSTPAKRYTGSDKTSDLFTSNISSEAWIKHCTGCFPRGKDNIQASALNFGAAKMGASQQSVDRDSTELSEQATTLSGMSKAKIRNLPPTWAAPNTPSAVENDSGASLSSIVDKSSLAVTPKPKDKGDQSISLNGAKSSASSFSPLSEAEIARYKEIALEILMQRKKNQRRDAEIKAYRDYSVIPIHRKKRQGTAQFKKAKSTEKPTPFKPVSKKPLPEKVEKQRSNSTGRLPRPESVNDRTIFWASQRIRNQIEKHKQRLLQTNKAKTKPTQEGISPYFHRRTDTKTSSTTTSNQSNTEHKDNGNPKDRTKIAVKPTLSTVTSATSLTVTSVTAVDKRPDKKMSMLSLDEKKPKELEPSRPPGLKNTLTTGTTTEWSPGKSDWASSVNFESDSRFTGGNAMAMEAQTDDSVGQVASECKSGDTGPVNAKLTYLDKLDFKDDALNYVRELPPTTFGSTQKGDKAKVAYEHSAQQTTPRLPQEDAGATSNGSKQSAQPTRYLDLLHNILKSPTSKTTQALSMFLQKPKALAEAERDLDITVDQIISSYQGIFEELRCVPSKQVHSSDKASVSSSPKKSSTPYESTSLGEDHFPQPVITCSASSCEVFSKVCCTKYDSSNLGSRRNPVNPTDLSYGNESREEIKCNVASNMTVPQSCKSSNFNVAIVSGRSVSRKFSGESPAPNDLRLGSASLHSALSTPRKHAPVPRKHSSFSSLKASKPPTSESTNHGFLKPSLPSSRKPDMMVCNKTQSQLSVEKKPSFKLDTSKKPLKVSSQISFKSNAFERKIPTPKQTIQSLKKKCVSLSSKGNFLPTGSKSATGDYCPKYQRDLAKWALEKENNQFELLLQSFHHNLLTAEHETLAMQHTRPAITIIAPQACLNISSTVIPEAARNKEADSEKSTSTKKSFTDIHILESHDKKRHSMDSFLKSKQGARQPVVCKTRRIRTFPLCRREIKKNITAPLPQGRPVVKAKKETGTEKAIEPLSRKNYLRKESSLSALSAKKDFSKGNPRLALPTAAKSRSMRVNSNITNSEHTIVRTPSNSSPTQANVHLKLTANSNVVQLRKSSSADCAVSAMSRHPNKEQGKKDSTVPGQQRKSEDAQLTKSDTSNYVVQVISSAKSSTHFENGPFDLDKSGAVSTLKLRQTKSITKAIQRRPVFRKQQIETKAKETKLKNQAEKIKSDSRQGQGSSLQQNSKEATRSASASSFNERGKTTLIPRRQRASKNHDFGVRKKSIPSAKSPRSASCPPENKDRPKLQDSLDAKEIRKDIARESKEKLCDVENNFISALTNITNECDNTKGSLESFNSRSGLQKDEDFKKPVFKLEERKVCLKEDYEMQPKLPTISTPSIGHCAVPGEHSSHHEVRAGQTSSDFPEKSADQQKRIEPDIICPGPVAVAIVIPPSNTVERSSSQSNVQIVSSSINSTPEFSTFPLINKRSFEAHVDNRYVTNASEKWPGRPVIPWKQPGSEEDSESEGMSLQAMRRQAVARTCEMIIRESKNGDKNKAEYTGDFAAINKLCNLQRSTEACLGLKTPTKWWPPELLGKTGWLMSSLRTDQEHNLGTKSTLSQDTLDSLAPINAETGEEDEESVDFLKSISSLKMCCKAQIMKDLVPMGLNKYIDSDSTQEDNVRLITTTDDHTEVYSPALTGDESVDRKERNNGILSNDRLTQGEEHKECFKTRELPTPKSNQQFNVNLQPKYFPLIETSNEKIDFFSESPLIQSSFESASYAFRINKSDAGADIEDSSSPCANSSQAGLHSSNKFRVDPPPSNIAEDLFAQGKHNQAGEAVASKEAISNIGDTVLSLTSLYREEGSIHSLNSKPDQILGTTSPHGEKFAHSIKREIVEMSVIVQEEITPRIHTFDEAYSPRTKSASDTKKSTDSFSSGALNQEGCAQYIDMANSVPFTHESKSTSLQFETHQSEQISEEMQEVIIKNIGNRELLAELDEVKPPEHCLAEKYVSASTQAPEKCHSMEDASISSREYSIAHVKSLPGFPNLPAAVVEPPSSSCDDYSPQRLTSHNDLSLLSSVKTPDDLLPLTLDAAEAFVKLTEPGTGNASLEIKVDPDKNFKDGQCQTGSFDDIKSNVPSVGFNDPGNEQETPKFVTKWTMTSEQESQIDRVSPTYDGEKAVSVLGESPCLQATVSLSIESEKKVSNEPLVGDDVLTCLYCSRPLPNSLQGYFNKDCPCVKNYSFWDNNAGIKAEPFASTQVCRKLNMKTGERTATGGVTAQEVKMRIRIELSGDNPCKGNKVKEASPSEDDQSSYPCCSFPVVFNPNGDNVQELTLHLGPLPKNSSSYRHQRMVKTLDNQGSDPFEKDSYSIETPGSKMNDHLEMPSLESVSPIRTHSITNESRQTFVPTPHSLTEDKLSAENFDETGLTSKAVSDTEEVQSFKVDSFRGLPATHYDHENLNVFSETENLYSSASRRVTTINDESVYVDRSQRIFYSGVSPKRCYRLHHTEEEMYPDISGRASHISRIKHLSGSTSVTNKTSPQKAVEKDCNLDNGKYISSPEVSPQVNKRTPCESLQHVNEAKAWTNALNKDKQHTHGRSPTNIQLVKTANEKLKDIEVLPDEPENQRGSLLSTDVTPIANELVGGPAKDAEICSKKSDSLTVLKSDEEKKVSVETKESSSCTRKLSRIRKINESLIQQKVAENLEMFIESMKELKLRQSWPSPMSKPSSWSCKNPFPVKQKSLPGDTWVGNSTPMSSKVEMTKSASETSKLYLRRSLTSSTGGSFSRLNIVQSSSKSPPKTEFIPREQRKMYPCVSNVFNFTSSTPVNRTYSLPTSFGKNNHTTKSSPKEAPKTTLAPKKETIYVKNMVFQSSVCLVSDASTNTDVSVEVLKEFETNSESDYADTLQCAFPHALNEPREIDELIAKESPVLKSYPFEHQSLNPTRHCSMLFGFSSHKQELDTEFLKLTQEKPRISSWNPFFKCISSNPFIANDTELCPDVEPSLINSSPQDYCSFMSQTVSPVRIHSNACSPLVDLPKSVSPQFQQASLTCEQPDVFTLKDLWLFASTEKRDDVRDADPRWSTKQGLLVDLPVYSCVEDNSSHVWAIDNEGPFISPTPKTTHFCRSLGNDGLFESPVIQNEANCTERDPFEFPTERCDSRLLSPGAKTNDSAREVESFEMFAEKRARRVENDSYSKKSMTWYTSQSAELRKAEHPPENVEMIKYSNICQQFSVNWKHAHQDLQLIASCSKYKSDFKEMSPIFNRSSLSLDNSDDNMESPCCLLACSEAPLLPHNKYAPDIYSSWISESSMSSPSATRVSSFYGDDESDNVSKATPIDMLDGIEVLTYYLMATYIKVKEKVKRRYLRKNKTKHKRLHKNGIHSSDLFRGMFLPNYATKKDRFTARSRKRSLTISTTRKVAKYSLLKEETLTSSPGSGGMGSDCSFLTNSTETSKQSNHMWGNVSDSTHPMSIDDQLRGYCQEALPLVRRKINVSPNMESASSTFLRKAVKLAESERSIEESPNLAKDSQKIFKQDQSQGEESRVFPPTSNYEQREISNSSRDSTRISDDRKVYVKDGQNQDDNKNSKKSEVVKAEEIELKPSSVEAALGLDSHCQQSQEDINAMRCQENTECPQTIVYSEDSVVNEVFAANSLNKLEDDGDKNEVRLRSKDDNENSQTIFQKEKLSETKFYVPEIPEEDEINDKITIQVDNKTSPTISHKEKLPDSGFDVESNVNDEAKIAILSQNDAEKKNVHTHSFHVHKSPGDKFYFIQVSPLPIGEEARKGMAENTHYDINTPPKISHLEEILENTFRVVHESSQYENRSAQTTSPTQTVDDNRDDLGKNYISLVKTCEENAKERRNRFDDKHCQTIMHIEEYTALHKSNVGEDSKCLNKDQIKSEIICVSDEENECSHSDAKSKSTGKDASPDCKCITDEGQNAYLCRGQNNNKKLLNLFHKTRELANSQSDAAKEVECLGQYQWNSAQSNGQGEDSTINSKTIWPHNYSCCSAGNNFVPKLVSVDRALSPISFENPDANPEKPIDDLEPTEFIPNDAEMPYDDGSGFIFCGSPQYPCIGPMHYLQALFFLLGGAEPYPFTPNPDFFDAKEAIPDSLDSDVDIKKKDASSLVERELSEGLKIRTKGYCALQRDNKHDKKHALVDTEDNLQQQISATKMASEFLDEARDVVYPTKMFEQDYDGEIHEVVFFTKDLVGDAADQDKIKEPTDWCKKDGWCPEERKSPPKIISGDDNLSICCHKVVPMEEQQLSPPKRRRTHPASKFGKLTSGSPGFQRKGESSDRSKDKYHIYGTGGSNFRSSRDNRGSVKPNSKPFSRKKMRLNRLLYNECMDQKWSPQYPSTSAEVFVQTSDDKINVDNYVEKREVETQKLETANVCNRTYSCQGHEEWVYYKNAPIDSTLLSEMQTEFNEKEGSVEALDKKPAVRSDSPFFFDDYELDTYEELGSLFTEMQESSSSVLLQDEVDQDDEKRLSQCRDSLSDTSASTKVSEPRCSFHGLRREHNTYCTTCAATQTFLSVNHYMSEMTSTSGDQESEELPRSKDTQTIDKNVSTASREMQQGETKCVHASSSKDYAANDMTRLAPTLTSCCTQTEPQAKADDVSAVSSESSKYVYFKNILHKCMQSQSFLKYVQKVVDERIGKKSTTDSEAVSPPKFIPVPPKPKPRSVLGHQCGQRGLEGDQQTILTEDVIERKTILSPPPAARREKLKVLSVDESSPKAFVRMQSLEDDSTEKSSEDAGKCRPVTCNTMSRRKMLYLRRPRRNKDTFITKKFLSESETHPISSSSLIIVWCDSTERPTEENDKDKTEELSVGLMTSASCCSIHNLESSIPSSTNITATISCPCKQKATVCDKACSVVNIISSPLGSSFKESQASLSKRRPKKKGIGGNSKPSLSEPNIKFEYEEENTAKGQDTPLADIKTSESTGTLTTTSVDYGRLKNIMSTETKKLWKSLTRLEKNSENCHVCRLQYNSLLTSSTDRIDIANLDDERVAHENHVHEAVKAWEVEYLKKQRADVFRVEASAHSKLDCIDNRTKETTSLTNNDKKANSPCEMAKLEDFSIISTRNTNAEPMNDVPRGGIEEQKEVAYSTIEKPLNRTSKCADVTKPETSPEGHFSRDLQTSSNQNPDKLDIPFQIEDQDYSFSDAHAKLRQNITACKNIDRRCGHYTTASTSNGQRHKRHQDLCLTKCQVSTQCQTDSESTHSCSPLAVKAESPSYGSSYQKLQQNRTDDGEKLHSKSHGKSNTDSTNTQSDTADYWIERLMNILHEMHQTFPTTATSSSVSSNKPSSRPSLPGKTETQQFRGCPGKQEKKGSQADNTASHNVCGLHKRNSVTENSEGKSNLSSHSYVPSQSSATMSPKLPNKVTSQKECTLSQQESCKESVSFSQSQNHKKPSFPCSSFLNVNSTGVVSEPLDLQRLQSLTSIASDCQFWDQVKFSNSRETNQKQQEHHPPSTLHAFSFLRHPNHTHFSSSSLHYKKYQLRRSRSVPELGHISHLNKSFNAPICLDNDTRNSVSIRSVKIIHERNKSSSLIRKTQSETHEELLDHHHNISEKILNEKRFKTTEENQKVCLTAVSQENDVHVSTKASKPAKTNSETFTNLLLSQVSSKSTGVISPMKEILKESARCKMLDFPSKQHCTPGRPIAGDSAELCTLQERQSDGGDGESKAKVQPRPPEVIVTLRESFHGQQKEKEVNVDNQVEGKRKPFREARHHRVTSPRENSKRGQSCSSEKSLNKSSAFRDPRKTSSLKDDEKTDEIQGEEEYWESVALNSSVSISGVGVVVENGTHDNNTTTHNSENPLKNGKDESVIDNKTDHKERIKTHFPHSREAPDGSLYLRGRAFLRRTQEHAEGDLKVTNSQCFNTFDEHRSTLGQVSEGDPDKDTPKEDNVIKNCAARENTERYLRHGAVNLQDSNVSKLGMTPKEIELNLNDEDAGVGSCVKNCVRENEMQKCCGDSCSLSIRKNNQNSVLIEVKKHLGIVIESEVCECLGNDVKNERNELIRKDCPNELNQLIRKDYPNEVNKLIVKDCPNEVYQLIRKECPNEVNQLIHKDYPNEVNQLIGKDCPNEVNKLICKDYPNEVNQLIGKDCPNEFNQLIRKECPNEVNQLIRKDCPNEVDQLICKECPNKFNQLICKDCPNEVNQLIRKDCPNKVNQLIRKDCRNEVNQLISKDCEASQQCGNAVENEVSQNICKDANNIIREDLCSCAINETTKSICKYLTSTSSEDARNAANDNTFSALCNDGQKEVKELKHSNEESELSCHKINRSKNGACLCAVDETFVKPHKDFPTESIGNCRSAVAVGVQDDTKFALGESTKNRSPRVEAVYSVRSCQFLFKETSKWLEARVDCNSLPLDDTKVGENEISSCAEEAVIFGRRLDRNADLQVEADRELKRFVQRDKKNLPIWKHWKEETVKVNTEENEVKRCSVFKNEDGIESNIFIQNDKKVRMSKNFPNMGTDQFASCMSPGKTRRLYASEEKQEMAAVLLRAPNCEVTKHCSPRIALRSEDSVNSVAHTSQSPKSPSSHGQPILFNVRLKPVSALWVEGGACGPSPSSYVSPDRENATAKQLPSDLAEATATLLNRTSVDETGFSHAAITRESPDNQGACLAEDSSVTTVDNLCIKYNLFTQKHPSRSPHAVQKSHRSKAEKALSVITSPSVNNGQHEGEEDFGYEEEGYLPSEGNSTLERFDPLSWEVTEEASMKSEQFDREYGHGSNKREAVGRGLHAALEIPVDIYTLPVRPTKKDAAFNKKKKKKKEDSFTRTVVISGPLSNFSIPVHRHISQTEDANEAREDDLSSKKAASSKTCTASHKSLSCRTKNSFTVDSPQRWMSTLRNFLPFRKKNSEKHKQMIPK